MDQHVQTLPDDQDDPPYGSSRPPVRQRRLRLKPLLLGVAALALLGAAAWYGTYYWTTGRFLVSTDDAYLQADNVIIAPKVAGYLAQVLVQDNQRVKAGQVLARIDDRDYRTALDVARASVLAEQAAISNLVQRIDQQKLAVQEAQATVKADRAELTFASLDYQRYANLSRTGAATTQEAQRATSRVAERQAILDHDAAAVGAAQKQIDVLDTELTRARADLLQRNANARQAELNLSYTTITAPQDGTVGVRTLRVGQYVQPGTQLMAIVPLQQVYVTANYKETQLTDVHAGQPVTIDVDTFPGAAVHGVVDSIAPASGQEFALLPPDNATGNFTKIVQRVPVKIALDPHDPLLGRLRPGMSVEPTIDTKAALAAHHG
jgi:membrane fusion protein (multidrug efflux system)